MLKYILKYKTIRAIISFSRAFYYIKIKKEIYSFEADPEHVSKLTIFSNRRRVIKDNSVHAHPTARYLFGIDIDFLGEKSSLFLFYLNSIFNYKKIRNQQNLLVIGPRNESEIFNFISKGFKLDNITAIDLFSYSPLIKKMDMHNLNLQLEYFDIVYAGWVIIYSENRKRALEQMIAVTKPGGLIALTATISAIPADEIEKKRGYVVGSAERFHDISNLVELFNDFTQECRIIYETPTTAMKQSMGMVVAQKIAKPERINNVLD
jgi:hypothetical protein